jgi:hypothetical protein
MKGFTGKTQKKLSEFTLDLLLTFYLNRYSGGVYYRRDQRFLKRVPRNLRFSGVAILISAPWQNIFFALPNIN